MTAVSLGARDCLSPPLPRPGPPLCPAVLGSPWLAMGSQQLHLRPRLPQQALPGSQYKLRKSSHLKKLNRYSDGLLRFGFSQDSGHGKSSSKMGKSEDFFYIKVSQKARAPTA